MNADIMAAKIAEILKGMDERELEAMQKLVVEIIRRDGPIYSKQRRKQ